MDREDTLIDYIQGKMDGKDRARFEADMAADPALAAEVEVMRAVRTKFSDMPRHEQAEDVWEKLSATMDARPAAANDNRLDWRQLTRYAAVAVLAVACWQFALAPLVTGDAPVYRTATEEGAGFTLQVRFADAATMSEITSLLSDLEGSITEGPSAIGLVQVSFPDEALRQQALGALQERTALVDFVQTP